MPSFVETNGFMDRSTVLRKHGSTRTHFDPYNKEHLESLTVFVRTGNWGSIQFYPEYPFVDVPMTVLMKHAGHILKTSRESAEEKIVRRTPYEPSPT